MKVTGSMERTRIEATARRLAAAVVAAHGAYERARRRDPEARGACVELADRVQDLATMVALLPRAHELRIAAEIADATHARWRLDPQSESLQLTIAIAFVERALLDTDPTFRAVA